MVHAENSVAGIIARFLKAHGVRTVFGLCGGHIMPIWMCLDREGIRIVDVRDERAAVHMAQAHAEVTGCLGVAVVTAGPGMTNAITGIANAHVSRAPVLVLSGTQSAAQENRGGLQDMDHVQLVRSITRYARTVRHPDQALNELGEAVARAYGDGGEPGPAFLDFPIDTLRSPFPAPLELAEHFSPSARPVLMPDPEAVERVVDVLWSARRPLVISGRGAKSAGPALRQLLDRLGCAYIDTGESRGLISANHAAFVSARRAQAMAQADVVLTVGRRLDFQLGFGSPAIFTNAQFVRVADNPAELRDNRRGVVEILASTPQTLAAICEQAGNRPAAVDRQWVCELRQEHSKRTANLVQSVESAPCGGDGAMHPNVLLTAIQQCVTDDTVLVTDGGDFLAFARQILEAPTMLDPGPFGCIGVGVPFGIAASLACPDSTVIVATGDGAFGFNAIEIDTAVRHQIPLLIVVANNSAWQIEVYDQQETYGKVVATRLQKSNYSEMARAFGMYAERVERAEDLAAALARASENLPALLDVIVTTDAVSSDAKSGLAKVPDLQPLTAWDDAERRWRSQ